MDTERVINAAERIKGIIAEIAVRDISIPVIRVHARDLDDDTIEAALSALCTQKVIHVHYLGFVVTFRRTE